MHDKVDMYEVLDYLEIYNIIADTYINIYIYPIVKIGSLKKINNEYYYSYVNRSNKYTYIVILSEHDQYFKYEYVLDKYINNTIININRELNNIQVNTKNEYIELISNYFLESSKTNNYNYIITNDNKEIFVEYIFHMNSFINDIFANNLDTQLLNYIKSNNTEFDILYQVKSEEYKTKIFNNLTTNLIPAYIHTETINLKIIASYSININNSQILSDDNIIYKYSDLIKKFEFDINNLSKQLYNSNYYIDNPINNLIKFISFIGLQLKTFIPNIKFGIESTQFKYQEMFDRVYINEVINIQIPLYLYKKFIEFDILSKIISNV